MPVEMTFASLQTQVASYLEKFSVNDPNALAQLPALINQAERRIGRELKILGFIQTVQGQFTVGQWVVPKPDRWRQTVSINYGAGTNSTGNANAIWNPLLPRVQEYVRAYNQDVSLVGAPKFYADYTYTQWLIAPTPDQAYPFEALYYEQPALLDATNTTNWITKYASNLLLYATLVECEPFIKEEERQPIWQNMYDRELAALNGEDQQKILDRQVTRQDD